MNRPTDEFTLKMAAEYLDRHPRIVQRYVKQGRLVPDKKYGRSLIFTRRTLVQFVATQQPRLNAKQEAARIAELAKNAALREGLLT